MLAQQTDGSVDCALDASLVGDGCSGTFDLVDNGDTLRVSIDGCVTPAITSLFACGFTKADVSTLASATSADCECVGEPLCDWNIYCDRSPGICVSEDGDPEACEDCSNGVDDDGNGVRRLRRSELPQRELRLWRDDGHVLEHDNDDTDDHLRRHYEHDPATRDDALARCEPPRLGGFDGSGNSLKCRQ